MINGVLLSDTGRIGGGVGEGEGIDCADLRLRVVVLTTEERLAGLGLLGT